MHQWTLKLTGKVKAENRVFSEFQNISPKIFINYKGKIKLYSVETCQMPQPLSDRLETPVLSETGPSQPSHDALRKHSIKSATVNLLITGKQQTNPDGGFTVYKILDQCSVRKTQRLRNCDRLENSEEK